MTTSTTTLTPPLALPSGAPAAARAVFKLLRRLRHGTLQVQWPDGTHTQFGEPATAGQVPRALLRLNNWQPCAATLRSGDIGFAETYIAGDWDTPDLPALLKLLLVNREQIESVVYGTWWGALAYRLKHLLNRNSRRGSRRNIHAHYDLGNPFYREWLDETMNYSSAWFEGDTQRPLADAQRAKVRRAIRECGLRPGERLLEIGCGWGAVAESAAVEFGARVTGVTLSTEQLAHAQARMARAGAAERCDLRLQDYRDIDDGPYDAVVSIEMFEAVGREYWPTFFQTLRRQLKTGGKACIQSITIREDLFERYVKSTDFIQQYVFPGGLLPSPARFREQAEAAGLAVVDELDFGPDYAETLARWRTAFLSREGPIRQLGYDAPFIRLWTFYLAYCEAAFATGNTSVMQFTLEKR
ncbi:cyclopropane-fatty-acyl-phospholipid synthase family protein [Aquincola tertiaricarbonis]|uniref:Cyclopropane-fatty-acyl-phospholipid synthase family protein n=1 Tax=Aquincola tertiaricarbonis TaxID=391953 RepID=A0ABY4SCB0_AQUTE|nr:cyclopropane-fatty-acyl-phospholipid synthase family protein [Aquincola tertiaricarbonis]URI09731.1 cyclopropane-fatty-acyl-phospholipid synthase family protein [Aquincola tertiaricarbonis]